MSRAILCPFLAALVLSGCSSGPLSSTQPANQVDSATQRACRERVNEIYQTRNRGDIFASNSSRDTPFSANFTPDNTTTGLADQFAYRNLRAECERNAGSDAAQPPAPVVPAPPAAKSH